MKALSLAFPKPKDMHKKATAVKVHRDGREVIDLTTAEGLSEYARRLDVMWERQRGVCGLRISRECLKQVPRRYATFDHTDGRGSGGSRRDDRISIDGKPFNCMACSSCNLLKGSRRI
jgi:hypothetical protein